MPFDRSARPRSRPATPVASLAGDATSCLSDNLLAEWLGGSIDPRRRERALEHVERCPSCRSMLVGLVGAGRERTLDKGDVVAGRYQLKTVVGVGAMGSVWAAYDRKLDRAVAVKVLRPELARSATARARLAREGRALARVEHPSVVRLHDIISEGEGVYVVRELVGGQSLDAWLAAIPRAWSSIVAVFVAAGRGLAAVHAVGLVHRDIKLDNIVVSGSGRVVVVDFGLAGDDAGGFGDSFTPVTAPGTLLGTPAYMAPEVLEGRRADARADQFAFCVALHRALFGMCPFAGDDFLSRAAAVVAGKIEPPPAGHRVPASVLAAIHRGLARDPDDRFANVDDLVDALLPALAG